MNRKVYVYDLNNILIKIFNRTEECAVYFGKSKDYINHNIVGCKKIQKDGRWYKLSRKAIK